MSLGKIKILSSFSNLGGSTLAHINLCNLFNRKGLDCTFYGKHPWHTRQCKGDLISNYKPDSSDILIPHFIGFDKRPEAKKVIFSCHETHVFPMKKIKRFFDVIHFVSKFQQDWHKNYIWDAADQELAPSFVIPNVLPPMKKKNYKTGRAAVIGSIDKHKNTVLSIKRALRDGYKEIYIFGVITQADYFEEEVKPLLNDNIRYWGTINQIQLMYDLVDAVYLSSPRETFNYVRAECLQTGVEYHGYNKDEQTIEYWDDDKIFEAWMYYFNL